MAVALAKTVMTVHFVKEQKGKTPVLLGDDWVYAENPTLSQLDTSAGRLVNTERELATTKAELATTKNELATTKNELATTKSELTATKTGLEQTRTELNTTKTALDNAKADMARSKVTFDGTRLSVLDESGRRVRIDLESMVYVVENANGSPMSFSDPQKQTCSQTVDVGTAISSLKAC